MRLQAEDDAITAQNDAIWGLIAPFLANQIARITIDFKMSIINSVILLTVVVITYNSLLLPDLTFASCLMKKFQFQGIFLCMLK